MIEPGMIVKAIAFSGETPGLVLGPYPGPTPGVWIIEFTKPPKGLSYVDGNHLEYIKTHPTHGIFHQCWLEPTTDFALEVLAVQRGLR